MFANCLPPMVLTPTAKFGAGTGDELFDDELLLPPLLDVDTEAPLPLLNEPDDEPDDT